MVFPLMSYCKWCGLCINKKLFININSVRVCLWSFLKSNCSQNNGSMSKYSTKTHISSTSSVKYSLYFLYLRSHLVHPLWGLGWVGMHVMCIHVCVHTHTHTHTHMINQKYTHKSKIQEYLEICFLIRFSINVYGYGCY